MCSLYKHIIITRFNLGAYKQSAPDYVNGDEYLSERFRLFDEICFPSLANQTNKNFTWFVLFNDKLPEKWKEKCEDYKHRFPNFEARYLSVQQTMNLYEFPYDFLSNEFISNELIGGGFIITTRIDNDDAFHLSFVDSIQKFFFQNKEEVIINYTNGLQYIEKHNVLKNLVSKNGHFPTRIEIFNNSLKTVLNFYHNKPPADVKIVYLKSSPMWIETVHKTNMSNSVIFQLRNLLEDLFFIGFKYKNLNAFGIKHDITLINPRIWKLFLLQVLYKIKKSAIIYFH